MQKALKLTSSAFFYSLWLDMYYGTITVHEAVCPLLVVAVMTAVPGVMPRTLPLASTVATDGSLLAHMSVLKSVFLGVIVALSVVFLPVFTVSAALDIRMPVG